MKINASLLKSKGWGQDEIAHAARIIEAAQARKHPTIMLLDSLCYWLLLAIAFVGNAAAAAFLLPLVAWIPGITIYFIVGLVASCFGVLFIGILRDLEKAYAKHYVIAAVTLPLGAIVSMLIMAQFAGANSVPGVIHSPAALSITYVGFFLIPYAWYVAEEHLDWFD